MAIKRADIDQSICKVADKMGQSVQEWTKENLWKTAFKKFEVIWST